MHLLVDAALNILIASKDFNIDLLQGHYETYMEDDCEVEILNVPGSCNKEMHVPLKKGYLSLTELSVVFSKMLVPSMTN